LWKSKKTSECINWLSVSDVHLGHLRTSTESILDNLEAILFDGRIADLDLLIIAGDLFERQLEYNHPASGRILLFVDKLLDECSKHDCVLRILEGTPSHDNKQNKIFDDVFATGKYSCNMKYVDKVSIEYFPEWGARALYVPDLHPVADIKASIDDLMESQGLQYVDFAVMHGAFSHQLPPMAKEVYDPMEFLKIVRHWILIGHVHFHSIFDRIAAGGSFDRLVHGEEGAKGLLMGTMNFNGDVKKDKIYFIENTGAKKYVTIDCTGHESVEESLVKIEEIVSRLPNESYIRIRGEKGNPIFSNMPEVMKINLANSWSKDEKLQEEEETLTEAEKEEGLETWVPIHLDKSNIVGITLDRLTAKNITGDVLQMAEKILLEAI
jgi:hypothetical protein